MILLIACFVLLSWLHGKGFIGKGLLGCMLWTWGMG